MSSSGDGWALRLGRYQDVLCDVEAFDACILDAPYSERTHGGHDGATRGDGRHDPAYGDRMTTRAINFPFWTDDDVGDCVEFIAPRCRGWIVSLTDHILWSSWSKWLDAAGFYVFPPLPLVEIGSRVRLTGDGPSSWTTFLCCARPRNREFARWGTLRGAYIYTGRGDRQLVGGKRTDSMRALVRDYTKPGSLVCDPTAGAATTARACQLEGRRFIGAEVDPYTHAAACRRLAEPYTAPLFDDDAQVQQTTIPGCDDDA